MKYGFSQIFNGSFDDAIMQVTKALEKEGFGVLTEINVQATLKKKLDIDRSPYLILGACNPTLANQALEADPNIGLLLPCNVVVREDSGGNVIVGFMDPEAVLTLVENPKVTKIAAEVRSRLMRVKNALNPDSSD